MARTRTRLQIRDEARALADMANGNFVTDAQANVWIDAALAELWEMLAAADPTRYLKIATVTTTQGTKSYALPADFHSDIFVDRLIGTSRYRIDPYSIQEKNQLQGIDRYTSGSNDTYGVRYRVMEQGIDGTASRIWFEPDPSTATYELGYVQAPQLLTADSSTFDGVGGWEEWIAYDVAIRMRNKEESDPSALVFERGRIEQRIKHMSAKRQAGVPRKIQDTRRYA